MASTRVGRAWGRAGWVLLLVTICAVPVAATSDVLSAWSAYYPASTLDTTYNCQLCHKSGSSAFNPYGASIRDAWTGTVQQAFASAAALDPDGDGYTSGVEIAANTHPGDAASHPVGDSAPPSAPTGLSATPVSAMRIDLSWTASTDNVGVAHYHVYRGGALVAQPAGTSYADMGLSPGTLYQYLVRAADAAGNESGPSNTASATTLSLAACDADMVSIDLPAHMIKGDTASATIAMRNLGAMTWTAAGGFALGAQSPADNTTWGRGRVALAGGHSIATGGQKSFAFTLTAPPQVGLLACDWQMVQDGGYGWFGPMAGGDIEVTSFDDVRMDHWAWQQVESVCAAGIVNGYDTTPPSYGPGLPVNRAQMAVFFARALAGGDAGVPPGPAEATFSDVPVGHWAFPYVEYVVSQGVVGGYEDGTYHPDTPVDRGQMAVFVARSIADPVGETGLASYTPPGSPTFADVDAGFWSYKYVEYIADPSRGITSGFDDGKYHPEMVCTREQMAVYVARAFKLAL